MKVTVIGSSSKGNSYAIEQDNEILLIECGMSYKEVIFAIKNKHRNVVGTLVTHEHLDHSKYTKDFLNKGLNVYASQGTMEKLELENHRRYKKLKAETVTKIGSNFTVIPFNIFHDVAEPLGFLIHVKGYGNVVFITDSKLLPFKFNNIKLFMVEANYDINILKKNVETGKAHMDLAKRIIDTHNEVHTTVKFLQKNVTDTTQAIMLLHLSESNADKTQFTELFRKEFGKETLIAQSQLQWESW